MVLRLSPQASTIMAPPPDASLNGLHPGRPSQIRLESNTDGRDTEPNDENHYTPSRRALNGTTPPDGATLPSEQQLSIRPKLTAQLTNGFRGDQSMSNDGGANGPEEDVQDNWQMRHGWEDQFNSEEYLSLLSSVSFTDAENTRCNSLARLTYVELLHVLHRQTT